MADTEEPRFNTLAERIAALSQQKNFASSTGNELSRNQRPPLPPPPPPSASARANSHPVLPTTQQAKPALPSRPSRSDRPQPPPLPRRDTAGSVKTGFASATDDGVAVANAHRPVPPPLPSRASTLSTQSLQPRGTSAPRITVAAARRGSNSSEISQLSNGSSLSAGQTCSSVTSNGTTLASGNRRLAPATYDPASLPPLPPRRRELEARARDSAAALRQARAKERDSCQKQTTFEVPRQVSPSLPARPNRPPSLPARSVTLPAPSAARNGSAEVAQHAPRRLPPLAVKGFGSAAAAHKARSPSPDKTTLVEAQDDATPPPPLPTTSRPSHAEIEAANLRGRSQADLSRGCLECRDWSEPDRVAARFPRGTLNRTDPVGQLASALCSPFPSYTDKARAIFTWTHHNIQYDVAGFFSGNIRSMSVEETIFSGKAVCSGYAEVYKAIANRAGLDCVVVAGHGKGFGHTPWRKGDRIPPRKPDGHAWNAVRIGGGDWKLIDACWGAGNVDGGKQQYTKAFKPVQFTMSNERFGHRHYPADPNLQFRGDGVRVAWEEYYKGPGDDEPPIVYSNLHEEGISEYSVQPKEKNIAVHSGEVVRFQFSKLCEHWTSEKNGLGKTPLLMLRINGLDGRAEDHVPLETNGFWHLVDVNARDLGVPGQSVDVAMLTTLGDRDGRGVGLQEYLAQRGRVGLSYAFLLKWELV